MIPVEHGVLWVRAGHARLCVAIHDGDPNGFRHPKAARYAATLERPLLLIGDDRRYRVGAVDKLEADGWILVGKPANFIPASVTGTPITGRIPVRIGDVLRLREGGALVTALATSEADETVYSAYLGNALRDSVTLVPFAEIPRAPGSPASLLERLAMDYAAFQASSVRAEKKRADTKAEILARFDKIDVALQHIADTKARPAKVTDSLAAFRHLANQLRAPKTGPVLVTATEAEIIRAIRGGSDAVNEALQAALARESAFLHEAADRDDTIARQAVQITDLRGTLDIVKDALTDTAKERDHAVHTAALGVEALGRERQSLIAMQQERDAALGALQDLRQTIAALLPPHEGPARDSLETLDALRAEIDGAYKRGLATSALITSILAVLAFQLNRG